MTKSTEYHANSRAYLARARARLNELTCEGLFYAAFELRNGIEARLQQYLEAHQQNKIKIKQGWRIAILEKKLERYFRTGDKIIRITIRDMAGTSSYILMYTPVTARLKKMHEKLGNFMHAMSEFRVSDDPWWKKTREFLESVWTELTKANKGNLLGAPLLNRKTGRVSIVSELLPGEALDDHKILIGQIGKAVNAEVTYLDEVP